MAKKVLTQKEWIVKYLMGHKGGLTPKKAEDLYGIMRLASRIAELREEGYPIEKDTVIVPNRRGQKCRVARYRWVA